MLFFLSLANGGSGQRRWRCHLAPSWGVLQIPREPPALPVPTQGHPSACTSFGCRSGPPAKGVPRWGGGRDLARNNRVEYRTGLNSRKYFQITKSVAWRQGRGGGPACGPFVASPGAGTGLQLTPSNPAPSHHLPTCKGALQLSAERITQKNCQCCPSLC